MCKKSLLVFHYLLELRIVRISRHLLVAKLQEAFERLYGRLDAMHFGKAYADILALLPSELATNAIDYRNVRIFFLSPAPHPTISL